MIKKEISRQEFSKLLLSSITDSLCSVATAVLLVLVLIGILSTEQDAKIIAKQIIDIIRLYFIIFPPLVL